MVRAIACHAIGRGFESRHSRHKTMLKNIFYKFLYKNSKYSQAAQDLFAYELFGKAGTYIDVGSGEPKRDNNTYMLESLYNWKGFSVDIGHSNPILKKIYNKDGHCAQKEKTKYIGQTH